MAEPEPGRRFLPPGINTPVILHVIPVGGSEPVHRASASCWCNPWAKSPTFFIHHALDLREVHERQGITDPNKSWACVGEPRPA